jgi:hypothetical protein
MQDGEIAQTDRPFLDRIRRRVFRALPASSQPGARGY